MFSNARVIVIGVGSDLYRCIDFIAWRYITHRNDVMWQYMHIRFGILMEIVSPIKYLTKIVIEYDQDIPQSQTSDKSEAS